MVAISKNKYENFFNKYPAPKMDILLHVRVIQEEFKRAYHHDFEFLAHALLDCTIENEELNGILQIIRESINTVDLLLFLKKKVAHHQRWQDLMRKVDVIAEMENLRIPLVQRKDFSVQNKNSFPNIYWAVTRDFLSFLEYQKKQEK
jgi:hypothetical protein